MKIIVASLLAIVFIIIILYVEHNKIKNKIGEKRETFQAELGSTELNNQTSNPSSVSCANTTDLNSTDKTIKIFNELAENLSTNLESLFVQHHEYTQTLV
uniref:Uncharacterized protein n=1 Tax=Pyramimonas orientalis virus TaxID=455367 RepID=A0A7L9AXV8_POV01|nr:hypothetical protein HWQ62_00343 [Pyramimonas orientalis virus]